MGSGWFHSQKAKKIRVQTASVRVRRISGEPNQSFVEGELEQTNADGDGGEAEEVNGVAAAGASDDLRWIFDHAIGEIEGDQTEGKVDEEDPVPVVIVGNPAAEGGTDGGGHDYGHAVESEGLAALFDGEGIGEDGLFAGGEATSSEALQDAREDEPAEAGSESAEDRADGKHDDAAHVEAFAPDAIGEPAGDGKDDGGGDEIAGENPGSFFLRSSDRAGDVRERDIGDGGVEHLHEGGDGDGERDQPGVVEGLPGSFNWRGGGHISVLI
jgi:hypothetical protein